MEEWLMTNPASPMETLDGYRARVREISCPLCRVGPTENCRAWDYATAAPGPAVEYVHDDRSLAYELAHPGNLAVAQKQAALNIEAHGAEGIAALFANDGPTHEQLLGVIAAPAEPLASAPR